MFYFLSKLSDVQHTQSYVTVLAPYATFRWDKTKSHEFINMFKNTINTRKDDVTIFINNDINDAV